LRASSLTIDYVSYPGRCSRLESAIASFTRRSGSSDAFQNKSGNPPTGIFPVAANFRYGHGDIGKRLLSPKLVLAEGFAQEVDKEADPDRNEPTRGSDGIKARRGRGIGVHYLP